MSGHSTNFTKTIHKEGYPAISPTRPELSQDGKTVLITGGSTGIGFAIATGFAQAGAKRIIIVGRRKDKNESSAAKLQAAYPNVQVDARQGDIGSLESTDRLWAGLAKEEVFIDVLVLNAVKFPEPLKLFDLGRDGVWDDFTINVRSVIDYAERFHKQPNEAKRHKVLLNVSTLAIHNFKASPMPNYSLVKNSQTLLIQLLALEANPEELQIVSFNPGGILTETAEAMGLTKDSYTWDDETLPGQFAVWAASREARFLHGRFVWAAWDVNELSQGPIRAQIDGDEDFLKIGVKGVHNGPTFDFGELIKNASS